MKSGPAILVAEDEECIRSLAKDYLEAFGFDVLQAANGSAAIDLICCEPSIKLVFSDIQMPGAVDGNELCSWLALNRPSMPVLLTSGCSAPDISTDPLHRFLAKPYDLQEMEHQIEELLSVAAA
ncbi:MAG: response regulator [Steroidobacteraceae bacterium]